MKKNMITAALFLLGITAFCQQEKITAFRANVADDISPKHKTDSSVKILKIFHQNFPEITDYSIYKDGDSYIVSIINKRNNSLCKVYYDTKGNILQTIKYYNEEDLPTFIRSKVDSKYRGKAISGITEFTNDDDHFYQVALEDSKSLLIVRFDSWGVMYNEMKYANAK
jgi:hypothetical protein